jgi:hypothetical protein
MDRFYVTTGLAVGLSFAAVGAAGVGPGLCFTAVGAAEFIDFVQPSAFQCLRRGLDFGPPPGCDDGPQPHNRTVNITALSSGNGSVVPSGAMIGHVFDAEHFQLSDYATLNARAAAYDKP